MCLCNRSFPRAFLFAEGSYDRPGLESLHGAGSAQDGSGTCATWGTTKPRGSGAGRASEGQSVDTCAPICTLRDSAIWPVSWLLHLSCCGCSNQDDPLGVLQAVILYQDEASPFLMAQLKGAGRG